jgi:hypothetical protein
MGGPLQSHDQSIGVLETVPTVDAGPMLTGVSVAATGRAFVNFPKRGDEVSFTVADIRDGVSVAFPRTRKWPVPAAARTRAWTGEIPACALK